MAMRIRISFPLIFMATLGGCAATMAGESADTWVVEGTSPLNDGAGRSVGIAQLERDGSNWRLELNVAGLAPGEHGIHLHEAGRCDGPDFATAKGHLNPLGKAHGSANPAGMHMGDLPNLVVGADGTAKSFVTVSAQLDIARVFDTDGTAVVIHDKIDDYRTDPSGNSGGRIACGVIRRP